MTDQEIFQAAVEKAVNNGFQIVFGDVAKWRVIAPMLGKPYLSVFLWSRRDDVFDADHTYEKKYQLEEIIFSHEFAKAFWGEEDKFVEKYAEIIEGAIEDFISVEEWEKNPREDSGTWLRYEPIYKWRNHGWKHYLQQMVLEEEPIKYLEQFL